MAGRVADFVNLHRRFSEVRDYLAKLAPPGKLAGRQHLDPVELGPPILPFINLVDVIRQGEELRFRFRLVGTRQTHAAGREITGKFTEEAVLPEYVDRINHNMRTVVQTKTPIYDAFPMPHPHREFIATERVYFPLATDGETVDMILTVSRYPDASNLG
jgi:hypothetical protein